MDCVANMGEIFHLLTETVDYHAFEPGLAGYKCLEKKLERSKSKFYFLALSNHDREQTCYLSPDKADSSRYQPPDFDSRLVVKCTRLDSIFEKTDAKIDWLKLEAEEEN